MKPLPLDWMPPEWPRDLPSHEAAFVFAMRLRPQEADYRRGERRKLARAAAACREAIAAIGACPTTFLAFARGPEDRRFGLLQDLERMSLYCEGAAQGRRGRPRDETLWMLIRACYRDFHREHPDVRGYWRETGSGQWRGLFLEDMEARLARLGFPAFSREAIGGATDRALSTTL